MLSNIPGDVAKHSGNVIKHSGESCQTFRGTSPNILGNVIKHSRESCQTFRGMSPKIPGNVAKYLGNVVNHYGEYSQTIQRILKNNLEFLVNHPVGSMKAFVWMYIIVLDSCDHELYLFVEKTLLLNSRKRKRASLRFLRKNKNILT